jgi:uncharacterized membrane protein
MKSIENKSKDEKKEFIDRKFAKYQNIQKYFIEHSSNLCTIIPCNINNYEETLVNNVFFLSILSDFLGSYS